MQRQAWTREDERKTRREKTAAWLEDVTASWALPRTVSRLLGEAKEVLLQSGGGTWHSWDVHCAVKYSSTEPYPSWHLHFGLPAFRTARPYIYGVLSCPAVGIILFYFINLFLAALVLGCHSQGFLSGGEWGLLSSCSGQAFHWSDFSCTAWAIGVGAQFLWPWGTWNLPRLGVKPTSPALAGEFITTGSPGKFLEFWNFKLPSCWGFVMAAVGTQHSIQQGHDISVTWSYFICSPSIPTSYRC